MALAAAASPAPGAIHDAKLQLPFHNRSSSSKHESEFWDSYEENASPHGHQVEDGLNPLASMVTPVDQQQHEKLHYPPPPTSGLSRNASFDSVTSHDSCTAASFSTGSPVTVLPPLSYTTCSGTGMDVSSSTMSAAAWVHTFDNNSNCKRGGSASAGLEAPEQEQQQQQPSSQESIFNTYNFHEQILLSDDCEQLLASPVGTLPSMLEFPPFSRFDDQACASNCSDFSPVSELVCLLPTSQSQQRTSCTDSSQQQVVKSPESVGNNSQQQEDFCQEFLVADREVYNGRGRSDLSTPPPAARRRLSWSEYQVPEPQRHPSPLESLQYKGFNSQAYDHQHHHSSPNVLPMVDETIIGAAVNPFRSCNVQDPLPGSSSLKRSYSAMMLQQQQQQVPSTCSISQSAAPAPSFSSANSYLKFAAGSSAAAALPVPPVPKCNIGAPILPPVSTNLSSKQQQDVAAFSALLYKSQGSEMMMMQHQQQGSSSSDSGARPLPPPKLRRRHGTATDPQSIAARTRRERFSDRIRILQSLVPNGERLDTVSMLGHTLEYVRFLQHQVWQLYNGNDDAAASADSESREKWKEFMDAQTIVA